MALSPTYLADTSALVRFGHDTVHDRIGSALSQGLVATCGVIDLEVLYSPLVTQVTPAGEALLEIRGAFLSRLVYQTFNGYVLSQFKKMLRSKDVQHAFFLPNFRVKQDLMPGIQTSVWFTPTKIGEYEIACAELCGLGHYRMRAFLSVRSQADYESWLAEQQEQQNGD